MSSAPSAMCLKCNECVPISVLCNHEEGCTAGSPDNGSTAEPPDDSIDSIAERHNDGSIPSRSDNEKVQYCYEYSTIVQKQTNCKHLCYI